MDLNETYSDIDLKKLSIRELIVKVIQYYYPDLKEEVERVKDRNNNYLRNMISERTGLSLVSKKSKYQVSESQEHGRKIYIEISDELPDKLNEILENIPNILLIYILHFRRMENAMKELNFQSENLERINNILSFDYSNNSFDLSAEQLVEIKKKIQADGIIEKIIKSAPRVIGEYFPNERTIKIYWIGIGVLNQIFGYKIEDLTIITMLHELAHAYTHQGFDKDGNTWNTEDFNIADDRICESIAQIYSELIINENFDYLINPFTKLKGQLDENYRINADWFNLKDKYVFEKVREILIKTRNQRITTIDGFNKLIDTVKKNSQLKK